MDVCEPAQIGPAAVAGTAVSSRRARGMRGHATNPSAGVSRAGGADPSSKEKAALRCGRLARYRRRTAGHAVDTWCHCKLSHRSDEDTKLGSDKKFEQLKFHVINIKAGIGIYSSSKKTEKFVYMTPQNHNIFCFGVCVTYVGREVPYDYSLLGIVP